MKQLTKKLFPYTDSGDKINMLFNCFVLGANTLSASVQLPNCINSFVAGQVSDGFIVLAVFILNIGIATWMVTLEHKRRRNTKHTVNYEQEAREMLRRQQEAQQELDQEQARLQAEAQAEQLALEKLEEQLSSSTHEQVSLPEIFAGRRRRLPS